MIAPRNTLIPLVIAVVLFCSVLPIQLLAEVRPGNIPTIRVTARAGKPSVAASLPSFKINTRTGTPPASTEDDFAASGILKSDEGRNLPHRDAEPSEPADVEDHDSSSKLVARQFVDDEASDLSEGRLPGDSDDSIVNRVVREQQASGQSSSMPVVLQQAGEISDSSDKNGLPVVSSEAFARLRLPGHIHTRARRMMKEGTSLAKRGAMFSARQEFLGVLKLVAQAYDSQLGVRYHSKALANGLRALREADDFVVSAAESTVDINLRPFIAAHKTPVLKGRAAESITPYVAMQHYYDYAREQLALAGNRAQPASAALYAIGRVETMLARSGTSRGAQAKPLAFYQSAVVVDQRNFAAANELGVMLARAGKFQEARAVLDEAVRARPTKALVENLAKVERLMGRGQVVARYPVQSEPRQETMARQVAVEWVDPVVFSSAHNRPPGPAVDPAAMPPDQLWRQPDHYEPTNVAHRGLPLHRPARPVR